MVAQLKHHQTPSAEFSTITPSTAREWLERNIGNYRAMKPGWVKSLAEDMRNGRWQENGESIKFDLDGKLVDGQHRLAACVRSNVPFRTLVVRGVADDVNIDTGRSRNLSDLLRRRGEKNYAALSSVLRWVRGYENGTLRTVIGDGSPPTMQELLLVLDRNPLVRDSIATGGTAKHLAPIAMVSAFHFIFTSRSNRETADLFFEKLTKGVDLAEHDPVYLLRQRLLRNVGAKAKLPRTELAALFIKAWNAWVNGRSLGILRWRGVGPTAEEFPEFE